MDIVYKHLKSEIKRSMLIKTRVKFTYIWIS